MASKTPALEFPWERLPNESPQAFEAFRLFRDLGDKRTQTEVSRRLQKSIALINRWAGAYDWKSRTLSYDNYLEKEALKEAKRQAKQMRARHIKLGMYLQKLAADKLESINPQEIELKDIRLLLKDGIEIERMSRAANTTESKSAVSETTSSEASGAAATLADAIMAAYSKRRRSDEA